MTPASPARTMQPTEDRLDIEEVIRELNVAGSGLAKANNLLYDAVTKFEGTMDSETGEVAWGLKIRWEIAVDVELEAIVTEYEGKDKRLPGEDVRQARAKRQARKKNEQLFVEYMQALSEIKAYRTWASNERQVISGKQSVLNGLRALGA